MKKTTRKKTTKAPQSIAVQLKDIRAARREIKLAQAEVAAIRGLIAKALRARAKRLI